MGRERFDMGWIFFGTGLSAAGLSAISYFRPGTQFTRQIASTRLTQKLLTAKDTEEQQENSRPS
jgi:hypothetical protein